MATIFALASGRPPAAIAIVRVSGPRAHHAARVIAGELPPPREASLRRFRRPGDGLLLDHGLLLRFDAPATATGEDVVEFHLHGGRAVVDALLHALGTIEGLRPAWPGEFTRRAFENGRMDLTEAEGLADLLQAETETQRRAALHSADGGLRRQIALWQDRLLRLSAAAEASIDYDEEVPEALETLCCDCAALAKELEEWLERPRAEPLREGVLVVLAGPPNSGKSSLLNAIVGQERAIVTERPGTTRDHIAVPLAIGGIPIVLVDTAGLRESEDTIEVIGIERARRLVDQADVLVWMGQPAEAPAHPRRILLHSRCDVPERGEAPEGSLPVSATTQQGLNQLLERVLAEAKELLPREDEVLLNRRQAEQLGQAQEAILRASNASETIFLAADLSEARSAFHRLTGSAGVEDVLDALFGRFCLGK